MIGDSIVDELDYKGLKCSTLYIKGSDPVDMGNVLNLSNSEKEKFIIKIDKIKERGFLPIIYAKKKLNKEETLNYLKRNKMIKTSLTINEQEIEDITIEIEEKCQLVCILYVKENIKKDVIHTLSTFNKANIKVIIRFKINKKKKKIKIYFASNDSEASTLACAYQSGILKKESIWKLNPTNENAALISIKYLLQRLQKHLSSNNNYQRASSSAMSKVLDTMDFSPKKMDKNKLDDFEENNELNSICIIINGPSFNLIYENKYLRKHLLFIMIFSKLILHDCKAKDKKRLVKLIKKIENASNKAVLAIGDG